MSSTVATAPEQATKQDSRVARPRRRVPAPYFLLIPSVVILLIGMGYPLIWQTITSFQEFGLSQQFGQPAPFVGFANYIELAGNPVMWGVVGRSLLFMAVTAIITLAVGLLLAVLMTAVGKVVRLTLQISLLLAWAMPVVAAMTVWIWLFDRRRGVVNYLLDMIPGVEMNRFAWLENPFTFFMVASIIVIWMSVPFVAFSVYAGLTQVSDEVLEAAQLDGASGWQRLRFIIMPMIRPVIAIVLLLQLIWDLRVFTQITMLQDAGSRASEFDLLGTYIYKLGAGSQDFGMASAVSIFVLLLTFAISWYYVRSLLKEDEQS
ncbi:carbohydrate ABC transporter permease [Microterricola viridarii]|uniref:Sugar ABC transporter permease n=1 Tax=Microterricola viridarii TaxID=412690 RepID=A0A120HZS6_9MICO|nr:sugar ABC transporter permease [Microterricola viridarii]AMB57752.1 sugar ABC transporter permease [Microterricola viridarii]